jgi:RNA polymerase sigma factor (sigma-70 family)
MYKSEGTNVMTDSELLRQFVCENSQTAFSQLVNRHKDWLYSACLRRLGDPAMAEDAVQTVFQVLSRKAAKLVDAQALSPWLHQAAKYAAHSLRRSQLRRAHYEREAAAMNSTQIPGPNELHWNRIEPDLEPALDQLAERDRQAILMRFYEQQSHSEIAEKLHISEEASQKRISRALERLRAILSRGGTTIPATAIAGLLLANAVRPAPAALAAACSAPAANLSPHAMAVSKAIGHGMTIAKIKLTAVAAAILLVIPTAGVVIHTHFGKNPAAFQVQTPAVPAVAPDSPAFSSSSTTENSPGTATDSSTDAAPGPNTVMMPNEEFKTYSADPAQYDIGLDGAMRRTPDSSPALMIRSLTPDATRGNRHYKFPGWQIVGQASRVRFTGWIKSQDVAKTCGMFVVVLGPHGATELSDEMEDRPIRGTNDWAQYSSVVNVPPDTTLLEVKLFLDGTGEVWGDDFRMDPVGNDVPTTDDSNWKISGADAGEYTAAADPQTLHNGVAAMRIGSDTAKKHHDICYQRVDHSPDEYLGHRVKFSAWMKSGQVLKDAGIVMIAADEDAKDIADDGQSEKRPIHGTTDWTLYTAYVNVPKNAAAIQYGFILNGSGNIWVDLASAKLEIADGAAQ